MLDMQVCMYSRLIPKSQLTERRTQLEKYISKRMKLLLKLGLHVFSCTYVYAKSKVYKLRSHDR